MKKISLILATLILSSMNCSAGGKTLGVPNVRQEQGNWCWIGSTDSVMRYLGIKKPNTGHFYKQCELLGWLENASDVCSNPKKYNHGGYMTEMRDILNHYNDVASDDVYIYINNILLQSISFNKIKKQIDGYNPIFRRIDWKNGGAHMTIVKGYIDDGANKKIVIMNPSGGTTEIRTYEDGVENSRSKWTKTMIVNTTNTDKDDDGIFDYKDNCPNISNSNQKDNDNDGIGNVCDNCKDIANIYQVDIDNDGIGNKCDDDMDNDNILNNNDNCKYAPNPNQEDSDNDGVGDICDNCKTQSNSNQHDSDCDGVGDVCDNIQNVFGCSGGIKIQYDNRLWNIIHPLDPITNIQITPYRVINTTNIQQQQNSTTEIR